jgi:MFS family permease
MSSGPNLKEIERRTYMSYHQDGLLDICIGWLILGPGLAGIMSFVWEIDSFIVRMIYYIFFGGIILPIYIIAKRKITMPRIGYVNFGKKGRNKFIAFGLGLIAAVWCAFFAFLFLCSPRFGDPLWQNLISQNILLIIGVGSLAVFVVFGYTIALKRFYGYGLLALIAFAVGHFLGIFFAYIPMVLGTTIMITGIALLISFVKKYPLQGGKSVAE